MYDGNGNVVGLVDAEAGSLTIEAKYEYSPFGEPIRAEGTYAGNAFRFSTKYQDAETGLLYYGHRYYSVLGADRRDRLLRTSSAGAHTGRGHAFLF